MKLDRVDPGSLGIDGYGNGGFRVGGVWYDGAVLIVPDLGVRPWDLSGDDPEVFAGIAAQPESVELLIMGTGPRAMPSEWSVSLFTQPMAFAVETMATPAACRTYNVLLAEGRRIAAALIPV